MFPRRFGRSWGGFLAGTIFLVCLLVPLRSLTTGQNSTQHDPIVLNAETMITRGRQVFRFDTLVMKLFGEDNCGSMKQLRVD